MTRWPERNWEWRKGQAVKLSRKEEWQFVWSCEPWQNIREILESIHGNPGKNGNAKGPVDHEHRELHKAWKPPKGWRVRYCLKTADQLSYIMVAESPRGERMVYGFNITIQGLPWEGCWLELEPFRPTARDAGIFMNEFPMLEAAC